MSGTLPSVTETLLENPLVIDGSHFELIRPITDFRRDPNEARILYICRKVSNAATCDATHREEGSQDDEYVVKIKVQVPPLSPEHQQTPLLGPSKYTAAELQALKTFTTHNLASAPHLIASKSTAQRVGDLFPEGYISYTVMTKMPGRDLMSLGFWSLPEEQRAQIREAFLKELKTIWRLGIAPYDCALRNILWEPDSRRCSIVDFEHWHEAKDPINMNENEEMQSWGIVQRPPAATWWAEWGIK